MHFVVPAGSLDHRKTRWQSKPGKYLFNADNLARVFRGKFLALMCDDHYYLPTNTPKEWNADCQLVGRGDGALTYLARYLYRGVINEQNILSVREDQVTFQYKDAQTQRYQKITEPAIKFLWRIMQHVLPKGFRRARDFGFLHGNAKRMLLRIQLLLKIQLPTLSFKPKRPICCPVCQNEMDLCLMRIGSQLIIGSTN